MNHWYTIIVCFIQIFVCCITNAANRHMHEMANQNIHMGNKNNFAKKNSIQFGEKNQSNKSNDKDSLKNTKNDNEFTKKHDTKQDKLEEQTAIKDESAEKNNIENVNNKKQLPSVSYSIEEFQIWLENYEDILLINRTGAIPMYQEETIKKTTQGLKLFDIKVVPKKYYLHYINLLLRAYPHVNSLSKRKLVSLIAKYYYKLPKKDKKIVQKIIELYPKLYDIRSIIRLIN